MDCDSALRARRQAQDRLLCRSSQCDNRRASSPISCGGGKAASSICAATAADSRSTPSALGGAEDVVGVDLDESALGKLAKQNANLNQRKSASCRPTFSRGCARRGAERPAFRCGRPRSRETDAATAKPSSTPLRQYYDMNKPALQAVRRAASSLTCSCTGLVSEADFLETLRQGRHGRPDGQCKSGAHRRGRRRPSVFGSRSRGALPQGGVLPRWTEFGFELAESALRPHQPRAFFA